MKQQARQFVSSMLSQKFSVVVLRDITSLSLSAILEKQIGWGLPSSVA
jgi:hypothetical protein